MDHNVVVVSLGKASPSRGSSLGLTSWNSSGSLWERGTLFSYLVPTCSWDDLGQGK
jgi:hypothetical protein